MTYKLPEPDFVRLSDLQSGLDKSWSASSMQAAYAAGQASQVRVSIPTNAMEQEFQTHYRRGYAAGLAEGRKLTEVWSVTSKVFSVLFATEAQADRFIAATTPAIGVTKNRIDVLQPAPEPVCRYPDCKCPTETPCLQGLKLPQLTTNSRNY